MRYLSSVLALLLLVTTVAGGSAPVRARSGMVVTQDRLASSIGADALPQGGTAIDQRLRRRLRLPLRCRGRQYWRGRISAMAPGFG